KKRICGLAKCIVTKSYGKDNIITFREINNCYSLLKCCMMIFPPKPLLRSPIYLFFCGVETQQLWKLTYLAIFSLYLLCSCNGIKERVPDISFDSSFPKREKNLTYILGNQFTFVSDADTQTVNVSFDSKTKLNYLTNAESGYTLSRCRVYKFRQLYYFSEQLNDTAFWIYAVKIEEKEIRGLQSGWEQMLALQEEIDKGKFSELIKYRDTINKITRLSFNKTKLKSFYKSIIESLPALKLINVVDDNIEINHTDTITSATSKEVLEQSASIVKSVYPNPASDNFNIEFSEEGNFKIELYDIRGRIIKTVISNSDKANILLIGIKKGTYYVRVTEQETNESALIKLIKQ
ncbi:MAG: T9SS type A sorting domain-containing protein, partial [Bacteroidia bacterium]